jgi:hypothetical protein
MEHVGLPGQKVGNENHLKNYARQLIDKILLAHDFSPSSRNTVATATELAKLFQAEVVPIHVLPDDLGNEKVIREVPCSFVTLKSEDIITLQLATSIQDIENHYHTGQQLVEDGFFAEAIEQFKLCLRINNMHVPAHFAIAKVYEQLDQPDRAEMYRNSARKILIRFWNQKIEEEVRKLRSY